MLRTQEEWYKFAIERGTDGSMVFDILKDWREEHKKPTKTIRCPNCGVDITDSEFSVGSRVRGFLDIGYTCLNCKLDIYLFKVEPTLLETKEEKYV